MATYTEGVGNMIINIEERGLKFDLRDSYETDPIVVKEIFEENVYEVNAGRFAVDGVTVDIGANIGAFALLAASHGSGSGSGSGSVSVSLSKESFGSCLLIMLISLFLV